MVEVHLVAVQADRLADAKTIAKHRQNEKVTADSMAPGPGGIEQAAISPSLRKSLQRSWASAAAAAILFTFRPPRVDAIAIKAPQISACCMIALESPLGESSSRHCHAGRYRSACYARIESAAASTLGEQAVLKA